MKRIYEKREKALKTTAPATLRSTSGAGYDFEDLISAWLMLNMLLGEPLPGVGGRGRALQAQVSALGWRIDDLLATGHDGERVRRLAISAKGNVQVSSAGLPPDFAGRAWEQWREPTSPMRRDDDCLALVMRSGPIAAFDPYWKEIKDASLGSDAELCLARVRENSNQSRIFENVRKAGGAETTDAEALALIRHLHVLPLDFQLAHSDRETESIGRCRRLLVSGDLSEAESLWRKLTEVAKQVRLQQGTITLVELWAMIRPNFALLDHPDFTADWQALRNVTDDYKSRIQTELPSGFSIHRPAAAKSLELAILQNRITVLFAESGIGKSSLVKTVLDQCFADRRQVWLGPEDMRTALNATRRPSMPLRNELLSVLQASAPAQNILVLDSAERIDPSELPVVKGLLDKLLEGGADNGWRIVIISQTQSWSERCQALIGTHIPALVELDALTTSDVKLALNYTPALAWLSAHDQTVAALTNARTLGWVVQAGPMLGSGASGLISHTAIADRLWGYWTKDRLDVQALIMRLGEREASFERSFPLTGFESGDLIILREVPPELPLRINRTSNRAEFEHDLAADWTRYQFLKQYASDTTRWAALAANPLWGGALRLLGQHLLRVADGDATAWDRALKEAEATALPLAADVLLDALALDPDAESLLHSRADLLFADNGRRLSKLMARFHYLGTIPRGPSVELGKRDGMGIYFDARFRSIVHGIWPPIARFLIARRDRIAPLLSPAVAKLVLTWLSETPPTFSDNTPVIFRREFAELALAMVRATQIEKAQGTISLTREPSLYAAALAGVPDLPDELADWALEMAGRRDTPQETKVAIATARRRLADEQAERLRSDPAAQKANNRRRQASLVALPGRTKLPPWPLGGSRDVDRDFRQACFKDQGLAPLMRTQPAIAAEVLLALIVESKPYEEYRSGRLDINLGLEFADDAYPTAFWKSPFFTFLQLAPQQALDSMISLVNFCTERWGAACQSEDDAAPPSIALSVAGIGIMEFTGLARVFDWTQENSSHDGNLHCALDAVERWLIQRLEANEDIGADIDRLLKGCKSVAALGLLVNVGKYKPHLFEDKLFPLLTHPWLYMWDIQRANDILTNFDQFSWVRGGEVIFELAKSWVLAPHRRRKLSDVAIDLIKSHEGVATRLREAIKGWELPDDDPKLALEQRLLMASLDRANYQEEVDPETQKPTLTFAYPEDVRVDAEDWQAKHARPMGLLQLPFQCEKALDNFSEISDGSAQHIYDLIKAAPEQELEQEYTHRAVVAVAATLLSCAERWLSERPSMRNELLAIIRQTVDAIGNDSKHIRAERIGIASEALKFAAFAVMHQWLKGGKTAATWEQAVLRLLTSGNAAAINTIVGIAYARRDQLGAAWWRLNQAGLLLSALSMLAPGYDDGEDTASRWAHWLARLRRLPLTKPGATWEALDFQRVTKGLERLERRRGQNIFAGNRPSWRVRRSPDEQISAGLDTHVLGMSLNWLTLGAGSGDLATDQELAKRLWRMEVQRQKAHGKDDGEYALPSQHLGYDLVRKLAALALAVPSTEAQGIWEEVLQHGPKAHYSVRQFISSLYRQLRKDADIEHFRSIWRATVTYALDEQWQKMPRHWFNGERILGDLLGFGFEDALGKLKPTTVVDMRDLYQRWSREHLSIDEENVARFASFLATKGGSPLRLESLLEIKSAYRSERGWPYRESTNDALVELLNVTLNENWAALANDVAARTAVIDIAANLAAASNPTALTLQERIKLLR